MSVCEPLGWFGGWVGLGGGAVPDCILIPHCVFLHRNTKLVSPYTVLLIPPPHPPPRLLRSRLTTCIAQGEASGASGSVKQIQCHLLGNTDGLAVAEVLFPLPALFVLYIVSQLHLASESERFVYQHHQFDELIAVLTYRFKWLFIRKCCLLEPSECCSEC